MFLTIYLDNAASSFPKPRAVIRRMESVLYENGANPGRSGHFLSEQAAGGIFTTRSAAAEMFSADPECVVFTKNATEALNCAITSLARPEKICLISDIEHNSVIRPAIRLKQQGKSGVAVISAGDGMLSEIERFLNTGKVSFVAMSHASNVTGQILPLEEIHDLCRKKNVPLINDASQTAGFLNCEPGDIVCMPGHKGLYGPQGTGMMIIRDRSLFQSLKPLTSGGTGTDSLILDPPDTIPESFEAGTLNTPGICALGEGIGFVKKNAAHFRPREILLYQSLWEGVRRMNGSAVYSSSGNRIPVLSFNLPGLSSEDVTARLSRRGICVRGGFHCSPFCHRKLQTVDLQGAVRVSLGAFTTRQDCEIFLYELKKIAEKRES